MNANGSITALFANANVDDLPSPHELDDRLRAFWVLRVGQIVGLDVMTPAEVSTVLRDVYSIDVPRQRVEGILSRESGTVAKRKKNRKKAYQLMGMAASSSTRSARRSRSSSPRRRSRSSARCTRSSAP